MQTLLKNIHQLVQIRETNFFLKGKMMNEVPTINNAFLIIENEIIHSYGEMKDYNGDENSFEEIIDCSGKIVMPTFVDSHTHIVFAKTREEEFVMRLKGQTYEEIAEAGGGILNSARKLQAASEDELFESAWGRLEEVISYGTGAIEIKSGYGLTVAAELKMLRVIKRIKEKSPIPVKANFLGSHAIPMEYKNNREAYIKLVVDEMLPQIAKEGLADYIDTFCEKGFYTVEETDFILKKGAEYGLKPKIHANQLAVSGGVQVGVQNNAISVDHLEETTQAEIDCLLGSNTIPTLLPSCSFFLNIPFAPARKLIDAGLGVVLATDYNPGSTPSGNMQFVASLGSIKMKMTPEEVLNSITQNASYALELEEKVGSITKGKLANLIISKPMESISYLPYSFGANIVDKIMLNGRIYNSKTS